MVLECEFLKTIPLHVQKLNYKKNVYELEAHVGEKELRSNLSSKLKPIRRNYYVSFPIFILENIQIKFAFPHAQLPLPKGPKQNTIGITRRTNVKLSHHKGHVLIYLVENEISHIHYVIE
jgi:hypothetical protein